MTKTKYTILFVLCLSLSSCFYYFGNFYKAKKYLSKGDCRKSYQSFLDIKEIKEKEKSFLLKAGKECEKKKHFQIATYFYKKAIRNLNHLEKNKIFKLEKSLANVYFKHLKKNEKAIFYYQKFLKKENLTIKEKFKFSYRSSVSFFNLEKYSQSLVEINETLKIAEKKDKIEAIMFKSRILFALKNHKISIDFFTEQILVFPKKENFFRTYLSLVFEEKGQIEKALEEIKKISPQTYFLKQKIKIFEKHLQER